MTYSQLKLELDLVRDNRHAMRNILRELETISDDMLSSSYSGAVDYSKDVVGSTTDPDKAMIETLSRIDREIEKLKKRYDLLEQENAHFEEIIMNMTGIDGEVMRLYYINGLKMTKVAARLHFDESTCWGFRKRALKKILEMEENRQ